MIVLAGGCLGLAASLASEAEGRRPTRMCEGLPDYEPLHARIPRRAAVVYRPADGIDRAGERFFCVRYALAPRLVSRPTWPRVTARIERRAWQVLDDGAAYRLVPPEQRPGRPR